MHKRRWWLLAGIACVAGCLFLLGTEQRRERWRELIFAPSLTRYPIRGIDVSHHQGSIDWARVKAAGYTFAFIKASEGADFRDTRFVENWEQANAAGLITGAYHFFTFCAPGVLQADHFLAVISEREHALPLGVDVELTGNCKAWDSVQNIHAELNAFVGRIEAARGEKILLYTELDQFETLVPAPLHQHALWLRSLWGEPDLPLPWLFWQHTDGGDVPGIRGPVDLDVFAGDWTTWRELVAASRPR